MTRPDMKPRVWAGVGPMCWSAISRHRSPTFFSRFGRATPLALSILCMVLALVPTQRKKRDWDLGVYKG